MNSVKVIFLDVDGVLCTRRSLEEYYAKHGAYCSGTQWPFDKLAVKLLNRLTNKTGAVIVISSNWQLVFDLGAMRQLFKDRGVTGQIVGMTGRYFGARGEAIDHWLQATPEVSSYVILDDDIDMLDSQLPRLIRCDFETGFGDPVLFSKALALLRK